jgi:hypothetical protein
MSESDEMLLMLRQIREDLAPLVEGQGRMLASLSRLEEGILTIGQGVLAVRQGLAGIRENLAAMAARSSERFDHLEQLS